MYHLLAGHDTPLQGYLRIFLCFSGKAGMCRGVFVKTFFASTPLDAVFSIATRNHVTISVQHLHIIVVSSVLSVFESKFSLAHLLAGLEVCGSSGTLARFLRDASFLSTRLLLSH